MAAEDTKAADTSDDKRQSLGNRNARISDNILPMVNSQNFLKILDDALMNYTYFTGKN